MRKRYRKASHWPPSFKWVARDQALIKEFERVWKGGRGFILKRQPGLDSTEDIVRAFINELEVEIAEPLDPVGGNPLD